MRKKMFDPRGYTRRIYDGSVGRGWGGGGRVTGQEVASYYEPINNMRTHKKYLASKFE